MRKALRRSGTLLSKGTAIWAATALGLGVLTAGATAQPGLASPAGPAHRAGPAKPARPARPAGSTSPAGPARRAGPAHRAGRVTSKTISLPAPSATGASNITNLGETTGWTVQSSAAAHQSGKTISAPGFNTSGWLKVATDSAGAPGTELEALQQNGGCPHVFFSDDMKKCYGQLTRIGPDTLARFKVPWWWRTSFTPHLHPGQVANLIVNGVIGSATLWLNGTRIATAATVTGAYTRFTFNITGHLVAGTNSLAMEINPNNPDKMFTVDNVDWTQIPPDNNTGIQFPVQLQIDGALAVGNSRVDQSDAANLSSAALTVKTDVTNSTAMSQAGTVTATIIPPGTGAPVKISQPVTIPPKTTTTVTFAPASFPALRLSHPRVWWPYQLGAQPLYTLTTSVAEHGSTLNSTRETFGIRTVTSYLTGSSKAEPQGARAFKINGVPIVIRGGGYDPNLFLHYSAADTAKQIALMKNLGINTIRLEGHIMPDDFFEQMDAAGILVNGGFQCCDAWQLGRKPTKAQQAVLANSALTIGENLRNHPSVFSFQWSDNAPDTIQESISLQAFREADFHDPLISSAEYNSSPHLGVSGEKEGPYDWVPPDYWYDTTHFDPTDPTRTDVGGSWGYDSEQSAGDTVPTLDSLRRFMSRRDLAILWRHPGANQYHLNYEGTKHVNYHFGTLFNFDKALRARYGAWHSLAQYVEEAQLQDYEDTRAQFEAFIDHSHRKPVPSTGTIYWQLDKGWPSMLWTLYGSDGDQAGSYFGAQEANRTLHAIYALDTGTVTIDNLGRATASGLSVESKVYSLTGALLDKRTARHLSLASQQVRTGVLRPRVPAATVPPARARTYFVELLLRDRRGTVIDRNVYWLSTQRDQTNWRATIGQPEGIISRYAGLTALRRLRSAAISVTARTTRRAGPDHADLATTVRITDTSASAVAFFLRADVRRGTARGELLPGGNELQSSIWQGNDITLWPGESQTIVVTYSSASLRGATPVITLSGWNVPGIDVAAPVP